MLTEYFADRHVIPVGKIGRAVDCTPSAVKGAATADADADKLVFGVGDAVTGEDFVSRGKHFPYNLLPAAADVCGECNFVKNQLLVIFGHFASAENYGTFRTAYVKP